MSSIQIPNLPAVIGLSGAELFEGVQAGSSVKISLDQIIAATRGGTPATLPIPVSLGGTGLDTFTIGDIMYASATQTFSKLADVALGNAIISGGIGAAPSYGKIGLTTHVDGVLPVLNGGTGVTTSTGTVSVVLSDSPALTGNVTVATNSASAAVTINQTGAGNAFVVEDSTSPDATPFVIDATGNVGIGVTPNSAWSTFKVLQLSTVGCLIANDFGSNNAQTILGSNTYFDSGFVYRYLISSTSASRYQQAVGAHIWYNAPSGTAGDAITFTQAMTLNASGNLGIGTSSPTQKLTVEAASGGTTARFRNTTAGNFIDFYETSGSTRQGYVGAVSTTDFNVWNDRAGYMAFGTSNTERMRIDASGNVGIGGTVPPSNPKLSMYGGIRFLANETAAATYTGIGSIAIDTVCVSTSGSERMRVDASGNVGIGKTNPAYSLEVVSDISASGFATFGRLVLRSAEGTVTAPTQITASTILGILDFTGNNATPNSYNTIASIRGVSDGAITSTSSPGYLTFRTTTSGSTSTQERMRIASDGSVTVGSSTTAIDFSIGGDVILPADTTQPRSIEIGSGRTGNGNSYIDFIGDATYTDYGLRIIRNAGANANSSIQHHGTGGLILNAEDASFIDFRTTNITRFIVGSAGQWGIGGAIYGTAGQAFVSGGAGVAPSWTSVGTFTTVTATTSVLSSGTGGVGYSTGAGVAVTQLTSRTTTTPTTGAKNSGAITVFTAAAVVGTYFSFTVPNTSIDITDTVVLAVRGGSNTYVANCSLIIAATSFRVTMVSVAGTASDTPIVNFTIIKGVSA